MQHKDLSADENEYYLRLIDMIFGDSDELIKRKFTRNDAEKIDRVLDTLRKRERESIVRICLYQITTSDIVREYHVSCKQADYIVAKALRKLRHPSRSKEIRRIIETDDNERKGDSI